MSDSNNENNGNQPRQPRNLQGLLKFAMEATKSEDPTRESHYSQMSAEDREFLEKVFKSMTIDVVEELNKAMQNLMSGNASEEEQIAALEVVTNFAADIDTANDFYKIGGFCILIPCLDSKYDEVKVGVAQLIAELAQNNEFCQQKLIELDILPRLVSMLSESAEVTSAVFHATSCIVRDYQPGLEAFVSLGGLECILGLISHDYEKLVIKSMFLISSIAEDSKIVNQLVEMNAIERIIATIKPCDRYDTRLEQTLAALDTLVQTDDAIRRSRDNRLAFKDNLARVIALGTGKSECEDQIELSKKLLERIS